MAAEQELALEMEDGTADTLLFTPSKPGEQPGILYLTDIGGIRPAQRKAAQRLADEGYLVLMPNVFYRTAKPPVMDLDALRPNPTLFTQRIQELMAPLTPANISRDATRYIEYLSEKAKPNCLGVVGFCSCGAFAMRVAAQFPEQVRACASFHGGYLYQDKPTSPHLLIPEIRARLLFGHAENDRSMPGEAIQGFEAALAAWGGEYESETYAGARHGWTTLDNPEYNRAQAERAFKKLKQLFDETLR